MRIISASRRTDIPAFYSKWFMERIRAGYCHFQNAFSGRVHRVSLAPEDVVAMVFWTRDTRPLLPHVDELWNQGYRFYFHFTLTGYPRLLEESTPPTAEAVDALRRTSDSISPGLVQWRYDPILVSNLTPPDYHLARFETLAKSLKGYTGRCYVSFAQFYGKTRRNLERLESEGLRVIEPDPDAKGALVRGLLGIAEAHGIRLYSCCDPDIAGIPGIERGSCVDPELVAALRPDLTLKPKPGPSREGCGCVESTDIGAFHTCVHGCRYCYATNSREAALERLSAHNHRDTVLYRSPALIGADLEKTGKELSPPRSKAESNGQMKLFGE